MPPKPSRTNKARTGAGDSPAAAPASTEERRVTRLRSRELGLETTAAASDDPGPARKKRGGDAAAKDKGAAAAGGGVDPPAWRPRIPPYPKSGKSRDVLRWVMEARRISELPAPAGTVVPCTRRWEPKDPRTAEDVASTADKGLIRKAARSVVGVVSTEPDAEEIELCTGIVVGWNVTTRLATIVTSSATLCRGGALIHPKPKLLVNLPNKTIVEGQLLFFNAHYRIALLEVLADSPLQPAKFGSSPKFGEEVALEDRRIARPVYSDSTAARFGISQGDIIVSYNGQYDFTLHKLAAPKLEQAQDKQEQ
ncbi:hypothetical protein E2562_033986 [Oryza meyeriana var. granulata]|uniref:PDZ domain-containing protein n=1 Tax=Oryza meyeriana var. granulata TaxID=110450 RepID=A0A6G1ES84_9ORYZ|nr:hypothetical protein E2562_033986 [Oryza meyeriana var. granulata]